MASLSHKTAEPEIFSGTSVPTVKDGLSCPSTTTHVIGRILACSRITRVTSGLSVVIIWIRGKDRFSRMKRGLAIDIPEAKVS